MANEKPCDMVLKPVNGVHGHGVQVLHFENGRFFDVNNAPVEISTLMQLWPEYKRWLIQDRIHPHRDLVRLSGSSYLQTLRAVTFVDHDGHATVPIAWLKIITRGNVFDNFAFGASGNLLATVDLVRANLDHVFAPGIAHHGLTLAMRHPDTDIVFADFQLPFAAETYSLVLRAAKIFMPLRTIGWDVAITDDGPSLIEGNVTWDPGPTLHDLRAIVAAFV
ncbi:MAG: hypothetical protein FWE49_00760 [Synergistaceae bacterium]|nr:hypothetical protein [Synergistaceae bacterium]